MVAIILFQIKKLTLGEIVRFVNFTEQVVTSYVCGVCVCARVHHTSPKTMHLYIYIKRKCLSFLKIFSTEKNFLQNAVFSYIAAH